MKATINYYSDDGVFEYEQDTETLFVWSEDHDLVGSIDLDKRGIKDLVAFLNDVLGELK